MPVYMSLLCWRPAIIRPPSVKVSAERLSSRDQKDGNSEDLQLAEIDNDNKSHDDEEIDSNQYIVTAIIGIQNKGMETGDEELGAVSTGEGSKLQSSRENPDFVENSMKKNDEPASASENPMIQANEKTSKDTEVNQNAELSSTSIGTAANPSEDTAHAQYSKDTNGSGKATHVSEGSVANENEKRHFTHNTTGMNLATTSENTPDTLVITKL